MDGNRFWVDSQTLVIPIMAVVVDVLPQDVSGCAPYRAMRICALRMRDAVADHAQGTAIDCLIKYWITAMSFSIVDAIRIMI